MLLIYNSEITDKLCMYLLGLMFYMQQHVLYWIGKLMVIIPYFHFCSCVFFFCGLMKSKVQQLCCHVSEGWYYIIEGTYSWSFINCCTLYYCNTSCHISTLTDKSAHYNNIIHSQSMSANLKLSSRKLVVHFVCSSACVYHFAVSWCLY